MSTRGSVRERVLDVTRTEYVATLPDGRQIAWVVTGDSDARPVLRLPGAPACRLVLPNGWDEWRQRGICLVATERPGFGLSTRLPGHGFLEHADDLAVILDLLEIDRVPMWAAGSGAPYLVAFAARHPDRISAGTVVSGQAPPDPHELAELIPVNRNSWECILEGDYDGILRLLKPLYDDFLLDPLGTAGDTMSTAPESDLQVIQQRRWQQLWVRNTADALQAGVEGWADESLAMGAGWAEIDLSQVRTDITWYHGRGDRNALFSAAERVVAQLPHTRLVEWPEDAGNFYVFERDSVCLDELLSRVPSDR